MARSIVDLPPNVKPPFEVFINGVQQTENVDYTIEGDHLIFAGRELRKDKVSGWRWFLGAWGVGTYRQDDSVDIRYRLGGRTLVAEGLEPRIEDDP